MVKEIVGINKWDFGDHTLFRVAVENRKFVHLRLYHRCTTTVDIFANSMSSGSRYSRRVSSNFAADSTQINLGSIGIGSGSSTGEYMNIYILGHGAVMLESQAFPTSQQMEAFLAPDGAIMDMFIRLNSSWVTAPARLIVVSADL